VKLIINTCNYFGYNIAYEGEKDLSVKIVNFVKMLRILNEMCKPMLSYGSELWTATTSYETRLI
jgi:hypothetical protein